MILDTTYGAVNYRQGKLKSNDSACPGGPIFPRSSVSQKRNVAGASSRRHQFAAAGSPSHVIFSQPQSESLGPKFLRTGELPRPISSLAAFHLNLVTYAAFAQAGGPFSCMILACQN
jgi:hypothetical protein